LTGLNMFDSSIHLEIGRIDLSRGRKCMKCVHKK
jgi:hypothetical protein